MLVPTLMISTNRELNNKALDYALEHYDMDIIVINNQEFNADDYRFKRKIKYLHEGWTLRQGFINSRNQLLEWFYASDYDWAVWMDANIRISETSVNDFRTVVDALKNDKIDVDVITATLGSTMSTTRMLARKAPDHLENVKLTDILSTSESHWLQALFMRNFKKEYDKEVYIDQRCNPKKGIGEDVFFNLLLRELFAVKQCPTIIVNAPPSKTSTWMPDQTKYPKIDWEGIKNLVKDTKYTRVRKEKKGTYVLPRVEYHNDKVTIYKPRRKKERKGGLL